MLFEKFIDTSHKWWSEYLHRIQKLNQENRIDSNGKKILYPSIILFSQFPKHYIVELIGAREQFEGLTIKRQTENSIHKYFNQFTESHNNAAFNLAGGHHKFKRLNLSRTSDLDIATNRFPQIEFYKSVLCFSSQSDSLFNFTDDFESFSIENSILVNHDQGLFRCKSILTAFTFKKSATRREVIETFERPDELNEVMGVHTVAPRDKGTMIAAQLQNLYLSPGLRETTIGEFFRLHPEIIHKAFNTSRFIYEPYFEWMEHDGTCTDSAINPDLMVQREDGHWDIYDLKTALLEKSKLTTGDRKRRALIKSVEDGLSQLANYREYFDYPLNAQHANEKYEVSVSKPKMVLVIGSWDNYDATEVAQARRKHDKDLEIIDYDTLCSMFRAQETNENIDSPSLA